MVAGFSYHQAFWDHKYESYHPERPERLGAVVKGLQKANIWDESLKITNRPASIEELCRVHNPDYVDFALSQLESGYGSLDPDTFFSSGTKEAALLAAGTSVDLAMAVHNRELEWGFAIHRPPGHHATWHTAKGFCIFNNIAVAAAALLENSDASRIAIVDWDVHHGNGTQDQFWDNPDVLFISAHQWPHFPGSGLINEIGGENALGKTVNLPFPAGARDPDYLLAMDIVILPLLKNFAPDHILISAGFDAHINDPLAGMELSSLCFGQMAARLGACAKDICDGRITLFLEGGYDLSALEKSTELVTRGIRGEIGITETSPDNCNPTHLEVIKSTISTLEPHWKSAFRPLNL